MEFVPTAALLRLVGEANVQDTARSGHTVSTHPHSPHCSFRSVFCPRRLLSRRCGAGRLPCATSTVFHTFAYTRRSHNRASFTLGAYPEHSDVVRASDRGGSSDGAGGARRGPCCWLAR